VGAGGNVRCSVQNRHQIRRQLRTHALSARLHNDKRKRQETTQVDEETACREQGEWRFCERGEELGELESPLRRRETRLDAHVADDEETEEQECDAAHSPAKAHARDQALDHDGQDDAADRGAADDEAEGEGAVLGEVLAYCC
jgi:hypothetical protein